MQVQFSSGAGFCSRLEVCGKYTSAIVPIPEKGALNKRHLGMRHFHPSSFSTQHEPVQRLVDYCWWPCQLTRAMPDLFRLKTRQAGKMTSARGCRYGTLVGQSEYEYSLGSNLESDEDELA